MDQDQEGVEDVLDCGFRWSGSWETSIGQAQGPAAGSTVQLDRVRRKFVLGTGQAHADKIVQSQTQPDNAPGTEFIANSSKS